MAVSRLARRVAAGLLLALVAGAAHAHGAVQGVGDFGGGFLHPLTALEDVLPFLALGLLAGQLLAIRRGTSAQLMLPVFWCALLAGALAALRWPAVPGVELTNIASILVLGALVSAALPLPNALYLGLALLFGLSHGYANGSEVAPPTRWYLFIPGVALAGVVATGYGFIVGDFLLRRKVYWMEIAVRVAGSWIAAIGLLVLAASWKRLMG